MSVIDIIGYIAGALALFSTLPQIIKSFKTKSTKDLSLSRSVIYITSVVLWLIYGILILNGPMIVINTIDLILIIILLFLQFKQR